MLANDDFKRCVFTEPGSSAQPLPSKDGLRLVAALAQAPDVQRRGEDADEGCGTDEPTARRGHDRFKLGAALRGRRRAIAFPRARRRRRGRLPFTARTPSPPASTSWRRPCRCARTRSPKVERLRSSRGGRRARGARHRGAAYSGEVASFASTAVVATCSAQVSRWRRNSFDAVRRIRDCEGMLDDQF